MLLVCCCHHRVRHRVARRWWQSRIARKRRHAGMIRDCPGVAAEAPATIHREVDPGNVGRQRGCQKDDGRADFFGGSQPPCWQHCATCGQEVWVRVVCSSCFRVNNPRRNGIYSDPTARPLHRQGFGEVDNTRSSSTFGVR